MDLESLAIKVSRSENLPALPQVVNTVLKMADDPTSSPIAMERAIERDTGLTAKLLRVASSSFYGGNQVTSVARAISVLGLNTVRSLVLALSMQTMSSSRMVVRNFDKKAYWQHCLATATAARILGKLLMPLKVEELYSAAMMHDIGLLVLERFAPQVLEQSIKLAMEENIPLEEAERQLFEFDHAEVGKLLADRWDLSPVLSNAIAYHHNVMEDLETSETTNVIAGANVLAHQCGFATIQGKNRPVPEMEPSVTMTINMPEDQLEIIRNVLVQEVNRTQESMLSAA